MINTISLINISFLVVVFILFYIYILYTGIISSYMYISHRYLIISRSRRSLIEFDSLSWVFVARFFLYGIDTISNIETLKNDDNKSTTLIESIVVDRWFWLIYPYKEWYYIIQFRFGSVRFGSSICAQALCNIHHSLCVHYRSPLLLRIQLSNLVSR